MMKFYKNSIFKLKCSIQAIRKSLNCSKKQKINLWKQKYSKYKINLKNMLSNNKKIKIKNMQVRHRLLLNLMWSNIYH